MGKLSRRWPAWPTQRTPCPETRHACQGHLLSGGFTMGGWAVQWAMLLGTSFMFGNQEEAGMSRNPTRPPQAYRTAP
eukprot:1154595-Pelagomonas_calceolata.AAC.10